MDFESVHLISSKIYLGHSSQNIVDECYYKKYNEIENHLFVCLFVLFCLFVWVFFFFVLFCKITFFNNWSPIFCIDRKRVTKTSKKAG